MIAIDTCSLIAYLDGSAGPDVERVDDALRTKQAVLPPVVLTEILSDAKLPQRTVELFKSLPTLDLSEGYWERAGVTRAAVLATGRRARIADALIVQSCLDHKLGLLTRDTDFEAFSKSCGLVLIE